MESSENQNQKSSKKYARLLLLLLFFLIIGAWIFLKKDKQSTPSPSNNTQNQVSTPKEDGNNLEGQEARELRLNFNDRRVVFTGYPYVDTAYRPRLYNLIYANTIHNYDDMLNLTDPSGKWEDLYEFSTAELKLFIPIGRTAANQPIWQTMEIVDTSDLDSLMPDCTASNYPLTGDLEAQSFTCTKNTGNEQYYKNSPCFVAVDDNTGILYKQYPSTESPAQNMCEVLKNNYFFKVNYEPFS